MWSLFWKTWRIFRCVGCCSIVTLVITHFHLCTLSLCSIHTNMLLIRTLCVVVLCILTLCAIFNLSIFVYINVVFVLYLERDNICGSEFNNTLIRTQSYHRCLLYYNAAEMWLFWPYYDLNNCTYKVIITVRHQLKLVNAFVCML